MNLLNMQDYILMETCLMYRLVKVSISERDLRKVKNRQKMAGGFRKKQGKEMYCRILSIVETLKRRKMNLMENIKQIFIGTPAIF